MTSLGTLPSFTNRYQARISAACASTASAVRCRFSFIGASCLGQPLAKIGAHELIVREVGMLAAYALDLLRLTGRQRFPRIQATDTLEQPLAPEHLVAPGNAAGE